MEINNMSKKNEEMKINISDEIAEGKFATITMISSTEDHFILDFIKLYIGQTKGNVISRILITPKHLKRLINVLSQEMKNFEDKYEEIKIEKNEKND